MTESWLAALGLSLLLTELFELAAALCLRKRGAALLVVLLANLLTNPPAVLGTLAALRFRPDLYVPWAIAAEAAAFITEALVYRAWKGFFPRPWLFSLLLNAISYGLGFLIQVL